MRWMFSANANQWKLLSKVKINQIIRSCHSNKSHNSHRNRCSWPACQTNCAGLSDPQLHEVECYILCMRRAPSRSSSTDILTNYYRSDILLTLRCLLLQWKYPDRWKKIMKLESHDQQRLGTPYYKYVEMNVQTCVTLFRFVFTFYFVFFRKNNREADERIVSYLVDNYWPELDNVEKESGQKVLMNRDKEMVHRICGIMEVNGLNIGLGVGNNDEVSALFENACILEHSCVPNCYYTFDIKKQFKITLRSGRLIKAGEHLSIMYTDMLWGTAMRQHHLSTNKYFRCKCERCLDPTELGTQFSSMKCMGDIGKTCGGTLLPKNPVDITRDWIWICDRCDVSIANEQIEIILTNIEQEVDDLMMASVSCDEPTSIGPASFDALIDKLSNVLHENHFHLFALKHTLIQMYGHKPSYLLHELTDELLHRKILMCEQLLSILDRIDPNTMRLTLYTSIVLYELHLAILEENRRQATIETEIDVEVVLLAQKYLDRGREALALNQDIQQGRQLIESFKQAENKLIVLLNKS